MSSPIAIATSSRFMAGCMPIPADLKAHRREEKQRYLDIKRRYSEEQSRRNSLATASADQSRRTSAAPSEASSTKSEKQKLQSKLIKGSTLKAQLKFYS